MTMATQEMRPSEELHLPQTITSPRAKLIYLYLVERAGATVDELCSQLRLTHLTVLSILRSLSDAGLVEKDDSVYKVAAGTTGQ